MQKNSLLYYQVWTNLKNVDIYCQKKLKTLLVQIFWKCGGVVASYDDDNNLPNLWKGIFMIPLNNEHGKIFIIKN
jgi:hypothetical protein